MEFIIPLQGTKKLAYRNLHIFRVAERLLSLIKNGNGFLVFEDKGPRTNQRTLAEKSYYSSPNGRYDTNLVPVERKRDKNVCPKSSTDFAVLFEKALAFVRV